MGNKKSFGRLNAGPVFSEVEVALVHVSLNGFVWVDWSNNEKNAVDIKI